MGVGEGLVEFGGIVFCNNLTYAELSRYAETQTTNYRSWAQIRELIGVIAYVFLGAVVTVYESGISAPGVRGLVFQLLCFGIKV